MKVDHIGFLMLTLGILVALVLVAPIWNKTVGTYVTALKA
jgi:hypothetical protein